MNRFLTVAAVLLALTFGHDTSFRAPHGWLWRCASVEEAAALDEITAAGGWVSSTGTSTKLEFVDQCLRVRQRDAYYWECGFGWAGYEAPRDATRRAGDAQVALLHDVPNVVEVDLCGTAVTDASLEVLAALASLRTINVFGTSISEEALGRFSRVRPEVRVDREDPLGYVLAELRAPSNQ